MDSFTAIWDSTQDFDDLAPMSDAEITELWRQEPLPPNQIFQLPANEEPIETHDHAEY